MYLVLIRELVGYPLDPEMAPEARDIPRLQVPGLIGP